MKVVNVAAVATVKNEADIVGATLAHLYSQGVARIYIADASTDGTRDVLAEHPVRVFNDTEDCHRQPWWIARLAGIAFEDGADWVIPFDADEFWCPTSRDVHLYDVFANVDDTVGKLYARMFHHYSWDEKETKPKPFPKVAFRAFPDVKVSNGNHEADVPGAAAHGLLEVRELQYRSEDHFVRKVRERNATLDPSLPEGEGGHHNRFAGLTDTELRQWWREEHPFWGNARNPVHDPIPSRFQACIQAS